MKIAIIGSGIAGLTAAYRLAKNPANRLTLFESTAGIGLDTHCQTIKTIASRQLVADVPPRMFNETMWPKLSELYRELGILHDSIDPSQSLSQTSANGNDCYFRVSDGSQPRVRLSAWFNRRARQIAGEAKRLLEQGRNDLADEETATITLDRYLQRNHYLDVFKYEYLYPALATTVLTCSYQSVGNYPADYVLQALRDLSIDGELRRVQGGTSAVALALTRRISDIRTSSKVSSISQLPHGALVKVDGQSPESFDHVVVATQANTASRLLVDIARQESELLRSVQYDDVDITLHQDSSWMPERKADWTCFNMLTDASQSSAACTVWMNRFHDRWKTEGLDVDYFQTIGSLDAKETDTVLTTTTLQRPVVTLKTRSTLDQIADFQRQPGRRIWYAGSWAENGIPLLESAVKSAERCVRQIESIGSAVPNSVQ